MVGDSGTILRRDATGWHAETSGTTRDLHAVQLVEGELLAVGDGGTILQREATGFWRSVRSHTESDLRAIAEAGIAVGRGGAIVDCARWTSAERSSFACVPRPSPTSGDLFAFRGEIGWKVLGGGGAALERDMIPGPVVYKPSQPFDMTLRSVATNHYTWAMEAGSDTLAVGDGGAVVVLPAGGPPARTSLGFPRSPWSFFFVAVSGALLSRLRHSEAVRAVLDGVNVASLALMAVVTVDLGRAAFVDVASVVLGLASAVVLLRFKLNSALLVISGALLGLALR